MFAGLQWELPPVKRVAVLGASTAALALAASIHKFALHEVGVFAPPPLHPARQYVRARVLGGPSLAVLRALPVDEEYLLRHVTEVSDAGVRNKHGQWIVHAPPDSLYFRPCGITTDAHLRKMLADIMPADAVEQSPAVVNIAQSADGASVHFADGTHVEADLVVAADGLHSRARHQVLRERLGERFHERRLQRFVPHDTGRVLLRATVRDPTRPLVPPRPLAAAVPHAVAEEAIGDEREGTEVGAVEGYEAAVKGEERCEMYESVHRGSKFIVHQLPEGLTQWTAVLPAATLDESLLPPPPPHSVDDLRHSAWYEGAELQRCKAALLRHFAGWHTPIEALIDAAYEVDVERVYSVRRMPYWYSGRLVLLGDAAAPVMPSVFNDCSRAFGCAAELLYFLRKKLRRFLHVPPERHLAHALDEYTARQRPRMSAYQRAVRTLDALGSNALLAPVLHRSHVMQSMAWRYAYRRTLAHFYEPPFYYDQRPE